ncbi:MAG: ABC transporter permease [Candidatus Obscuribacter sp.]|nr:ABC transporter permease [Candidatus Obscuribacter sp.]
MFKAIIAIMSKDILAWTRRPLYFFASVLMAVLILVCVGNTISGVNEMPFGLYDPAGISELSKHLTETGRFKVQVFDDLDKGKNELANENIVALANVSQDPLEDSVQILTAGNNPLVDDQISMGLLSVLTQRAKELSIPLHSAALYQVNFGLRDYIIAGLTAYLCYVLASMNLGFSWIYEWMEKTYRQIVLAPMGLDAAIIAKTITVTMEASTVLWLALSLTSPLAGFKIGNNFLGLVGATLLSVFTFSCIALVFACFLRTIRVYTMTISILGVALMFVSGIITPIKAMPYWEQQLASSMPLYYASDLTKAAMLGIPCDYGRDIVVLLSFAFGSLILSRFVLARSKASL